MHVINIPLLYRKDNSGGNSSNVCTDDICFQEVLFQRKERDNKPWSWKYSKPNIKYASDKYTSHSSHPSLSDGESWNIFQKVYIGGT